MGDTSFTNMDHLIERAQGSLDRVLQSRVTIASNSIEIYSLFEHMHIALIQTANDDPNFISIITNRDSEEDSSDPTMESLLREINELIIKIDEIIG